MPRTYNTAGQSTREMAEKRRKQGMTWGIIAVVAVIGAYILFSNNLLFGGGGIGLLAFLIVLRVVADGFDSYARRQEKKIHRADRGAVAEEKIGELLDQLDEDFEILHDVDSPYGNIDHLVISRQGGIFLLETKSHRGTITTTDSEILLNGHDPEKDFIAQALQNSYWVRDQVELAIQQKAWVTAVVVFTNAFVKSGRPVKGVRVINKKYLLDLLNKTAGANKNNTQIWEKREQVIACLMGDEPEPSPFVQEEDPKFCPKCGAELVRKTAKGGAQLGKDFMVCPKYPECKTAIPVEK